MNQKLQQNEDGSFSIVDPVTRVPYPGTIGMEKEKPYRCEVCGKRYKNLNGLKYHRQHTATCNSDLKPSLGVTAGVPGLVGLQGFGS
jgi:transcription factor SFP1